MEGARGFWSYVHRDDDDEGGRIGQLAKLLEARVRFLTGSDFHIFLDRASIGWGDDWAARIDEALLSTTFFIPIVTPSYFLSEECRRELFRFASSAASLGLRELVLPIYYADVSEMNSPEPADELMALVHRFNWEDFRDAALEDVDSSVHRKAVHQLAEQLIERAESADAKPALDRPVPPVGPEGSRDDDGDESEESEGVLEILSEGEGALPRLNDLMTKELAPLMQRMGEEAERATAEIESSDARGKGFAGRLTVSKKYARQLAAIADELEPTTRRFIEELLSVDQMVELIFRLTAESPEQATELQAFFDGVRSMAEASEAGLGSAEELASSVRSNARWSKDLREPSRRLETALRQIADARSITRGWLERLESFEETIAVLMDDRAVEGVGEAERAIAAGDVVRGVAKVRKLRAG